MRTKIKYIVLILFLSGFAILLGIGLKSPPNRLKSTDISAIHAIAVNNRDTIQLTKNELGYWGNLDFEIVSSEYPGETPDFVIDLIGEKTSFTEPSEIK